METGGFLFYTEKDGRLAEAEQRKIAYLEARIDYTRPETILRVYDKAIQEQIFKTPVGLLYLKKLQDFLLKQPKIAKEKVQPIPLYETYTQEMAAPGTDKESKGRESREARRRERTKAGLQISVILNIMLVLAVCAVMIISLTGGRANIFNYERVLQDKYAAWEQDLTAREKVIREKERELSLDGAGALQEEERVFTE